MPPKNYPAWFFFLFLLDFFIGPLLDVEMAVINEREVGLACILFILGIA